MMMGTLRCDHPDIEAFIDAKQDPTKLHMSNLSVLVTDVFMTAVPQDDLWKLRIDGRVHKSIRARLISEPFTARATNHPVVCTLPLHDLWPAAASSSRSVTTRCNSSTIRFGADTCSSASATAR